MANLRSVYDLKSRHRTSMTGRSVGGSVIKQHSEQQILLAGKQVSLKKNILKKEEQFQKEFNNGSHLVAKTEYSLFTLSQSPEI